MPTVAFVPEVIIFDSLRERAQRMSAFLSEYFCCRVADQGDEPESLVGLYAVLGNGEAEKRFMREWRQRHGDMPLLFLGMVQSESTGLELLRAGADDFLVIPTDAQWRDIPLAINRAITKRERRRAQEQSVSEALHYAISLAAILDSVHEGIFCFDDAGIIRVFNKHAEHIFGLDADDILGKHFLKLLPDAIAKDVWSSLIVYKSGGMPDFIERRHEFMGQRRDGECFPMMLSISEASIGNQKHFVASVEDISSRKATEAALHFALELDVLLTKWSTRFINLEINEIFCSVENALKDIGELCRVDRVQLLMYDYDGEHISCLSEWCAPDIESDKALVQMEPVAMAMPMHTQIRLGLPIACDDVATLPEINERDLFAASSVKSFLLLPMSCEERVIGYLEMDCVVHARQWSVSDKSQLQLAAIMLANALARREREIALRAAHEELQLANKTLQHMVRIDALTHLANRRHFDEVLQQEFRRAQREHKSLGLVLVDVDNFKKYNDTYGHPAGDACLKQVAQALNGGFQRAGEFCARYGGEEFVVLLPGNDLAQALKAAERARAAVQQLSLLHGHNGFEKVVTASFGVAVFEPGSGLTPQSLLQCADKALYEAKRAGKNRSMCFGLLSMNSDADTFSLNRV